MATPEKPTFAAGEALIEEMMLLAASAGYTLLEREKLRDSIRAWLPRFARRSVRSPLEPDEVETALLQLLANYTRQLRTEIAP